MSSVLVVGTGDTKRLELEYVRDLIRAAGADAVFVDVGTTGHESAGDVTPEAVAAHHPDGADAVESDDRGAAISAMSVALEHYVLANSDDVSGIIGAGGSGGTALVTPAMRALPVGVPKMMVSTVASSNVAPYVGPADIAMMYSVTDVSGINRISRQVLGNAAHAMAGMVANTVPAGRSDLPPVALSMFGVTTPLVTRLSQELADRYDPLVFHATGTGGQSMEKLVDSGMVVAVLDMTTTEVADELVGGVFPAGPGRMDAIARTGVPYVGSAGAVDMVNFGAMATVPKEFADRNLHVHNAQVTLMRTTPAENTAIGEFIARKLNACTGPVRFLLPEGGVSMIDAPGQPFHDPVADDALFAAIEANVEQNENRVVTRVAANINEEPFVEAVMSAFADVMPADQGGTS
ncbi:Tm-1-like ATP-binding domain-containing protein [Ilumatobacter nonamiensis]|uniref:Tm-1-like ATP-binding domain-containing protein n=1 Tax=Ilumatobacter nonamiensis TaxID=467093 RepID=UPI000345F718|nr:Tm-1-like ATP-binding domain-containing protein [Ilumatobacter nonamiensis]